MHGGACVGSKTQTGMNLLEFLKANEGVVKARSEEKSSALADGRQSSIASQSGLPIFFAQLLRVLEYEHTDVARGEVQAKMMAEAANDSDEPAVSTAAGLPYDAELATSAGAFGKELQYLGYTLSHVVHAYGAMCQAITEIAIEQNMAIKTEEFRVLNRCLDTAIAGAVTVFHADQLEGVTNRETRNLGILTHELRNALAIINTSLRLIRNGTVGFGGSVGQIMDRALKRQQQLIDRSLVEMRLRTDPEVYKEQVSLFELIDHVMIAVDTDARLKSQVFDVRIEPGLELEADKYLLFSAVSMLLQNAIQYTDSGGVIRVRAHKNRNMAVVEIEDQRGGVDHAFPNDLFQSLEQQSKSRDGMGPGLTIAKHAIDLNGGSIDVKSLPVRGCIFRICLPLLQNAALPV